MAQFGMKIDTGHQRGSDRFGGKGSGSGGQLVATHGNKVLSNGHGGSAERCSMFRGSRDDEARVHQLNQESVGRDRLHAKRAQDVRWKICGVESDNHVCDTCEGGGEDVSVVGIRKGKAMLPTLVITDAAATDVPIHEAAGAHQICQAQHQASGDGLSTLLGGDGLPSTRAIGQLRLQLLFGDESLFQKMLSGRNRIGDPNRLKRPFFDQRDNRVRRRVFVTPPFRLDVPARKTQLHKQFVQLLVTHAISIHGGLLLGPRAAGEIGGIAPPLCGSVDFSGVSVQ
jgi:hypothetical protein